MIKHSLSLARWHIVKFSLWFMIKHSLSLAEQHMIESLLWFMIKHLFSSAEEFVLLRFHLIWIMFLLISATVIDVNSMFSWRQMSLLILMTVVNVDSMFLQEQMFFWREIMMFWNHHWDFLSAVESFFKVWETSLILFTNTDKLMIFLNDLMIILSWFLMLRVLNYRVKITSVDADWLKKFFKSSLMYAKSWVNFLSSASILLRP